MRYRAPIGVACSVMLTLLVGPLSGQYAAHVVITGGSHPGTYDLRRPSCTIDGVSQVSLVDTSAVGQANRLASVVLSPSRFMLEFGGDNAARVTPAGFSSNDASHLRGTGTLTLTWVYGDITFSGEFAGTTREGADSVHVVATIGCKGVKRTQ
jgi:hypothetical protein